MTSLSPHPKKITKPNRRPWSRRTRFGRYLAATAVGLPTNLVLYLALLEFAAWPPPLANVLAAAVATSCRFSINKLWVWKERSIDRLPLEALVHASLTIGGLVLSTGVAWLLSRAAASNAVLLAGNVTAFGLLWATRYMVNERWLYPTPDETDLDCP